MPAMVLLSGLYMFIHAVTAGAQHTANTVHCESREHALAAIKYSCCSWLKVCF